tara:strand:+ start:447 stop:938 length:492 start_codon:yes stop_codon:yes gene_type:complete
MKKLQKALLATVALTLVAPAAFAADQTTPKKTKKVTELVGYDVQEVETQTGAKVDTFAKIDANANGIVDWKEFRDHANLDNEYEIFSRIDVDGNKSITLNEYTSFNKTKGNTAVESELHGKGKREVKGTNLTSRVMKRQYYVPVDRKVVAVEPIENDPNNPFQ